MTCEPWSKIIILLLLLLLKIILIMLIIIIIILVIYYFYHYYYNSNIVFFQESKVHIDPFASPHGTPCPVRTDPFGICLSIFCLFPCICIHFELVDVPNKVVK